MNSTIQQILTFPPKTCIPRFEGIATNVYERKTGTNQNGDWSIQNIMLRDDAGATIKLSLRDHDPFPYPEGTRVVLAAKQGAKGLSGLYAEDDTYQGQTNRVLKATKTCLIGVPAPAGFSADHPAGQAPQQQEPDIPWDHQEPTQYQNQPRQSAPANSTTPQSARNADTTTEAKREILQISNLHLQCALVVERYEAPMFHAATGNDMTPEQKQAAVASIFIKAERSGLVAKMPTKPFDLDSLV